MPLHSSTEMSRPITTLSPTTTPPPSTIYQWAVVGAGPAGIAALGHLLDASIPPSSIVWIDPEFAVGDLGTKWRRVSSNTTVALFLRFYEKCKSFEFERRGYAIETLKPTSTCELELAAEPLRDITRLLRGKVASVEGEVLQLKQKDMMWECIVSPATHLPILSSPTSPAPLAPVPRSVVAANVILATGAIPRSLTLHHTYPAVQEIPVEMALDPERFVASVGPSDTVAIFGSSHTAVILIRTLLEQSNVGRVVNFYREGLKYALYLDDWILFDDTGLKGETANWSREHLHGTLPPRLTRVFSDTSSTAQYLPQCTKVVYATGFERRELLIEGLPPRPSYNAHCGIITPGLFGCGIGYPEQHTDRYGTVESRVGLWKFTDYLERVIPLWMKYSLLEGIGQPKPKVL